MPETFAGLVSIGDYELESTEFEPLGMLDLRLYERAKNILQRWADGQGHSRCHWHPEVLQELCRLFDITPSVPIIRPPVAEFRAGCELFTIQEYNLCGG